MPQDRLPSRLGLSLRDQRLERYVIKVAFDQIETRQVGKEAPFVWVDLGSWIFIHEGPYLLYVSLELTKFSDLSAQNGIRLLKGAWKRIESSSGESFEYVHVLLRALTSKQQIVSIRRLKS